MSSSKYRIPRGFPDAPATVRRLTVGEEGEGQRLDNYLLRILKGVPKSHVYRIVRSGEVRVNAGRAAADTRLARGDELRIPPIRARLPSRDTAKPAKPVPDESLRVLFEDDALIALDKPAGIAVHGGSGISFGIIERLRRARPEARFLELAHRLDRETSGVLLVAKKRAALTALHAQLRDGQVDKRYLVLVRGRWRDAKRVVDLPLESRTAGGEKRVRVAPAGRPATTIFRLVQRYPAAPPLALLEAELLTGRTHQIRVHLTHLGFPLAGDDKYGDFAWNKTLARHGLKRMFLHARSIDLAHPLTGEVLHIESPLAPDLAQFLSRLDALVNEVNA